MAPDTGGPITLVDAERQALLFAEVARGLLSTPRRIPEKLFYDERGAELFEEITRLEAYYPTRLEIQILERCLAEVAERVGPLASIVEFGSGSGRKTELLLDSLDRPARYIPIDISEAQLFAFAGRLNAEYPELRVLPSPADYTRPFELPVGGGMGRDPSERTLLFFPGSSIGNFEPEEAERFLRRAAVGSPSGALFLVGVDLVKDRAILERAYNDPEGVTAAFNRNILRHLNELFEGDFAAAEWAHRALWNPECSRIEMRLVSAAEREVTLDAGLPDHTPLQIRFSAGDEIVTEYSYKYRSAQFEALCRQAGWRPVQRWSDPDEWFAVHLLESEDPRG